VGARVVGRDGKRRMESDVLTSTGRMFGNKELEWTWAIPSDRSSFGLIYLMRMVAHNGHNGGLNVAIIARKPTRGPRVIASRGGVWGRQADVKRRRPVHNVLKHH
jgi:hypothetical protein